MNRKPGRIRWILLIFPALLFAVDSKFLRQKTVELLDRYCPDGSRIIHMALEDVPNGDGHDFTTMMEDAENEQDCAEAINTIVHEELHGLNTFMGRHILEKKYNRESTVFYDYEYTYLKDGGNCLIRRTSTFPSKELVANFPEHLKTFRFDTYINSESELQSTQNQGVYGLLDEFNAYYQGTKASYDLLGYYENKGKNADWHAFFAGVNGTYYGCLEFRLYILRYLMFARDHHPEIYREITGNLDLIHAFLSVDALVSDLIKSYFEKKPLVFERLKGYGWNAYDKDNTFFIQSGGRTTGHINFMDVYSLLDDEMKKQEYQDVMESLKKAEKRWNSALVFSKIEEEMKREKGGFPGFPDEKKGEEDDDQPDLPVGSSLDGMTMTLYDPAGDAGCAFIDLRAGSVSRDDQGITVRMELQSPEARLKFNQPGVENNSLEYEWAVYFDPDGDGEDDYSLGFSHFKWEGSSSVQDGIIGGTQIDLWELNGNSATKADADIHGDLEGHTLIIRISTGPMISEISENTIIHFRTFFTDGNHTFEDLLPD